MATEQISCAPDDGINESSNEDLVAVFEAEGLTDLLVLDGATSVADTNYLDARQGDVAWFVQAFAAELGKTLDAARSQADSVHLASAAVQRAYRDRTAGQAVPLYAHPLAALTWIRIRQGAEGLAVSLYCLGDCKTFALDAQGTVTDLDPYVNPFETVVQDAVAALAQEGVSDPDQRRVRLLPLLRARREAQHGARAPSVLCLAPQGPYQAREYALHLPSDTTIVAMSDGFNRLADAYGLYTQAELVRQCRGAGLASLMAQLRAFETARAAAALAVKNADDASAVMWTPDRANLLHSSKRPDRSGPPSARPTEETA